MAFNKKQIPCLFALFLFSFSIFPLILSVNLDRHGNDIYVTVDPFGEVRGKSFPSQYHKLPNLWINVFLGIPYAKRPSQFGDQWREKFRFMNPENPSWYGTWDATFSRPACPQMPWYIRETLPNFNDFSEDCLYMDIYAPRRTDETTSSTLYPVMVFFHGGGFIMGSSHQHPGLFLAERRVVVVVVNFRLNALGFLSTGDRYSPGNYGMFDQVQALKVVKQTIHSYRGDPKRITVVGHSSGAASVGLHLLSPRSDRCSVPAIRASFSTTCLKNCGKGECLGTTTCLMTVAGDLFHQAVVLAGSDLADWAVIPRASAVEYSRRLAHGVGCPTSDTWRLVDCLRYSRSFMEIVNASARVRMHPGSIGNPWGPVVDGQLVGVNYAFLPDHPRQMRRQGRMRDVKVLAGMNMDDGSYFIPNLPNLIDGVSQAQFDNILREFLQQRHVDSYDSVFRALRFQYTYWPVVRNATYIRQELVEMITDYLFGSPISEMLEYQAQINTVYFYVFQYRSWRDYTPTWRGVSHGEELQYVFGFPFINTTYIKLTGIHPRQEYDFSDRNISEYMMTLLTNFTARGNPTPRDQPIKWFRNTTWLEYNPVNHSYLCIGNQSSNRGNHRMSEYGFWREYFPVISGLPYRLDVDAEKGDRVGRENGMRVLAYSLAVVVALLVAVVLVMCYVLVKRSRVKRY